ncbi:MAG TPA: ATP-binding protein [Nitrospiraceae bacterium]|nr:ATP-binding protein [Nitrospiraceae bacterium]
MPVSLNTRWQAGLVIVLFLGSLGTLLYNSFTAVALPQRELQVRTLLQEASRTMAHSADSVLRSFSWKNPTQLEELHRALIVITNQALADFSGVEGGFYLSDVDRFSGYGFPTSRKDLPPEPHRTDPPPLEAPLIRLQAQQSLSERTALFTVRDVGPSRVMVVTEAIGTDRPAQAVTWAMVRLTGPEQMESQLRRYQLSGGLALAGLALALVLTYTLTRSLVGQRAAQQRLREELRRSEQLATLGKLLTGVAHEIRNPLAGIRSTIQLWQRMPNQAHVAGSIDAVVQATDRLNEILTRLLHFARAEHAERRPNQMNELVVETFKLLEAQAASQGVNLEQNLEPGLPLVPGSPAALRQVILNLATNALHAMPNGGRLRCNTHHLKPSHAVEITVADDGPGISFKDREHLFEPFFTTRQEGTGLGLALCREIVLQHGGLIELAAQSGQGATFRVLLPTAER